LGVIVSVLLVTVMAVVRLGLYRNAVLPIGFGVPIVVIAYFRNRPLLWGSFAAFTVIVGTKYFVAGADLHLEAPLSPASTGLLVELDLLLVAAIGHIWISLQKKADDRNRELEAINVRKTRFLAAVSHDVRTPANAISLLADLIRRTAANPAQVGEIPELAQELYNSSVFLVNLLTDVLDIARFDSGKMELTLSDFSLGSLMEQERDRLAPLAREKPIGYRWIAPPEPIWLRADRVKLSRVLGNLVGNAIKFTDKGEVCVEAGRGADGSVRICVKDTGIGIAPDHQRDIFEEFVQLRNAERDRTKGMGLGLSICLRLVQGMRGTLEVQSVPGEGSTFIVTLPADCVIPTPVVSSKQSHP
jgi:signal transduction histidine kinase